VTKGMLGDEEPCNGSCLEIQGALVKVLVPQGGGGQILPRCLQFDHHNFV